MSDKISFLNQQHFRSVCEQWKLLDPVLLGEFQISASAQMVSKCREEIMKQIYNFAEYKNSGFFFVGFDEVVSNIVEHNFQYDGRSQIKVWIFAQDQKLALILAYLGDPFDMLSIRAKSPQKQVEKGADGGYGLYLIKRIFSRYNYTIDKSVNYLSLLFNDKKKFIS